MFAAGAYQAVYVFSTDAAGDLVPVPGSPFETAYTSSVSASVSPNGAFVATAGTHGGMAANVVHVLAVSASGALSPVPGSPFPDPVAPPTQPWSVDWTPDGERLLIGHLNGVPGLVMVYDVADSGALTPVPGAPFATGGDHPVALAVDATGSWVFVTHKYHDVTAVLAMDAAGGLSPIAGSPFPNSAWGYHSGIVLR